MKPEQKQQIWIAGLIALVAIAVRVYGIGWGLPQMYEEATPLRKAMQMWFGPMGTVDPNPHFFRYPSLMIYTQFAGEWLLMVGMKMAGAVESRVDFVALWEVDKTPFVLFARFIAVLFAVATVWLTFRLSLAVAGLAAAIAAALLLALNPVHITTSQMVGVDIPLVFFCVLTLLLAVRLLEAPTRRNYLLVGLAIGLATSTKYTGAMLVLPLVAAHGIALRRHATRRGALWVSLAVAAVIALASFALTSPYVLLDFARFRADLDAEREHMRLGHFGLYGLPTWRFYLQAVAIRLLGWPLAILALWGVIHFLFVRRAPWALVFSAFLVPYVIAVNNWSMKADRYLLPILPVALIFASAMSAEGLRVARVAKLPRGRRVAIAAVAIILLGAPLAAGYPAHLKRLGPDSRTTAQKWIEENIPSGSFIVRESYGPHLFGPQEIFQLPQGVREAVIERTVDIPRFAVQPLLMFQVAPERSEVFYDLSLYRMADYIVTTGSVRSRYVADPIRFARQVAFYDSLESEFVRVADFPPQGGEGTNIIVYKNPAHNQPFGIRRSVSPPQPLRFGRPTATGSEELFYYNLGLNYEAFGYYEESLAAYDLAFRYPIRRPTVARHLVLGKVRSLGRLGRREEARALLKRAQEQFERDD